MLGKVLLHGLYAARAVEEDVGAALVLEHPCPAVLRLHCGSRLVRAHGMGVLNLLADDLIGELRPLPDTFHHVLYGALAGSEPEHVGQYLPHPCHGHTLAVEQVSRKSLRHRPVVHTVPHAFGQAGVGGVPALAPALV